MQSISNGASFELKRLIDGSLDRARQKELFEPAYVHGIERERDQLIQENQRLRNLLFERPE